MTQQLTKRQLIELAKILRRSASRQEERLWDVLCALPVKFVRHMVIEPYIFDFYCEEAKLVVEVEGALRSEMKPKLHDDERRRFLGARGLRCLRYLDWQIDENFLEVCEEIQKAIRSPDLAPCTGA